MRPSFPLVSWTEDVNCIDSGSLPSFLFIVFIVTTQMHATTVYTDTMKVHFYKYKFLLVLFRKDDTLLLYIRDTIEISNQIQPHAKYYYFL